MKRVIAMTVLAVGFYQGAASAAPASWISLFNGKDLTGWKTDTPGKFKVEDGQLIGFQDDGKPGDLFTVDSYDNFELRFSYQVDWPANSGIWFRNGYQFDVLKYNAPRTYSGAFYYPGCKGTFAWVNADEGLEHPSEWNEGRIYANGNRIAFWLNGKKLGEQNLIEGQDKILPQGKIGLQVHRGFQGMAIRIRSMEIRTLQPGEEPVDPPEQAPRPVLHSGDRVALIGGGLFERARLYGRIETSLQLAVGEGVKGLRLRNLGWSGDSVFHDARSYFGKPEEGQKRIQQNVAEWQPQVVLLNYGAGAAMSVGQGWTHQAGAAARSAGSLEEGLAVFAEGYQQVIDAIRAQAPESLREIVLVAPPPFENLGPPLPDHHINNRHLSRFRNVIRDLAAKNRLRFVDLFARLGGDALAGEPVGHPLTTDGIHFTGPGYQRVATALVEGMGYTAPAISESDQAVQQLRAAVIEKNRLFFHRWRPANETYLFLFRKHEQGNNAKEIPQFDPLIAEQEQTIEGLRTKAFKAIGN